MVRLFESMSIVDLFMVTCQRISFSKPIFDGLTYGGLMKSDREFKLYLFFNVSRRNLLIASNTAIGKVKTVLTLLYRLHNVSESNRVDSTKGSHISHLG